jgi:hypothetical protein
MINVYLSEEEVKIARFLGKRRRESARAGFVKDTQIGKQNPIDIDVDGVLAELAFAKRFNLYPDLSVGPRSGGADFIVNSKTIDIKATRYITGKLLATIKKAKDPCDYYVLAVINKDNDIKLCGMASKEKLFIEENIVDLGHGKGYCLSQEKLDIISI